MNTFKWGMFRLTGDFSLAIEPVTLDDDARYQCQVSPGPRNEPGIRSRFARLIVLVPPEKPRIIQGHSLETTEDSEIKLECVSQGGKPAAEVRHERNFRAFRRNTRIVIGFVSDHLD